MMALKVEISGGMTRQRWRALSAAAVSVVLGAIAVAGSTMATTIPADLGASVSEDERDAALRRRMAKP